MKFLYEESINADKWLTSAKEDLKLARLGQECHDIRYELFCYHCQQAAEKSLKALLIFKLGKYPKTHSLDELIKNLKRIILQFLKISKKKHFQRYAMGDNNLWDMWAYSDIR